MLVEDRENHLGWTALHRAAERDVVVVMKNPRELPITMLWYSNGGRDYAPWNGRHRGVLGIEDGRTAVGHRQSIGDNSLKSADVPTSFTLSPHGVVTFRHVIGAFPWEELPDTILQQDGSLLVRSKESQLNLPFDTEFLAG
jgi:hypothetical protein